MLLGNQRIISIYVLDCNNFHTSHYQNVISKGNMRSEMKILGYYNSIYLF